jgi:hypothetical protein
MRLLISAVITGLLAAALFAQPPAPGVLRFDPRHLRLHWDHRRWQILTQDGTILKDFGPAEHEARRALRLIHELGLNEYGTVGSPRPLLEYWLADGQAPRALVRSDLRVIPLDPTSLHVEKMHGQYTLKEKVRVLFSFESEADANRALEVFQKHRFSHVGLLGLGSPLMTVFFAPPDAAAVTTPGRHLGGTKFPRFAKNADGSPRIEQLKGKATGLEGVVPAVIPPIAGRPTVSAPVHGVAAPTLTDRQSAMWRGTPTFGRETNAPAKVGEDGRVVFDWRQAKLRQDRGEWVIGAGSQVLARFGANMHAGQTVLSALCYYRCTELEHVGQECAGRWFAVPPSSPRGVMLGLSSISVRPDKLEVALVAGRYALCEEGRLVLPIGERAEDARRALELIRRHGADRVCQVGTGPEGIALLVRSR